MIIYVFYQTPRSFWGFFFFFGRLLWYWFGSACVSERHANFILAERGGKAADVIQLMKLVADRVEQQFGIRLEPEVEVW